MSAFRRRSDTPLWWYNLSSDLRASAGAIWLSRESQSSEEIVQKLGLGNGFSMAIAGGNVFLMLFGMSLEMILKACVVADGKEPRFSHDLVKLARDAAVNYEPDEIEVLQVLTHYIFWAGRYPAPKQKEVWENLESLSWEVAWSPIGPGPIRQYNGRLDWDQLDPIWRKALAGLSTRQGVFG